MLTVTVPAAHEIDTIDTAPAYTMPPVDKVTDWPTGPAALGVTVARGVPSSLQVPAASAPDVNDRMGR